MSLLPRISSEAPRSGFLPLLVVLTLTKTVTLGDRGGYQYTKTGPWRSWLQ